MPMFSREILREGWLKLCKIYIVNVCINTIELRNLHCLCAIQVLYEALKNGANKKTRKALTRVIVSQSDAYMKNIKEEFQTEYGVALSKKIEDTASGSYKDFLVKLVGGGN